MSGFNGFSPELITFLKELARNNNRTWFEENKKRYITHAKEPMLTFIRAMGERLEKISTSYRADPRGNGGSMFRIYRDTRFSKNKAPYKENIGCQFRHSAGKDVHAPGFYVHIQPGNCFIGGGIWMPPTAVLTQIRDSIVNRQEQWIALKKYLDSMDQISPIQGDRLKTAPRGYDREHPLIEDLKFKSYFASRNFTDQEVVSPNFIDQVDTTFHDVMPLMTFLTDALGLSS